LVIDQLTPAVTSPQVNAILNKVSAMSERDVFLAVLDLDGPWARAAYLDQACEGDTALRAKVDALLKSHADAGSFLNEPAAGELDITVAPTWHGTDQPAGSVPIGTGTDKQAVPERPRTVIGPYKLLQQIGEGGMGTV
jgi:eukaryotic-like serine/threonine-protein kinase